MNHSVFICHSKSDTDTVCRLQESLTNLGFEARIDKRVIRSGDPLGPETRKAIESAGVFLLIVSKEANHSEWVQRETQYALQIKIQRQGRYCILPILLDEAELGALKWIIPEDTQSIACTAGDEGITHIMPQLLDALEQALSPSKSIP